MFYFFCYYHYTYLFVVFIFICSSEGVAFLQIGGSVGLRGYVYSFALVSKPEQEAYKKRAQVFSTFHLLHLLWIEEERDSVFEKRETPSTSVRV